MEVCGGKNKEITKILIRLGKVGLITVEKNLNRIEYFDNEND